MRFARAEGLLLGIVIEETMDNSEIDVEPCFCARLDGLANEQGPVVRRGDRVWRPPMPFIAGRTGASDDRHPPCPPRLVMHSKVITSDTLKRQRAPGNGELAGRLASRHP